MRDSRTLQGMARVRSGQAPAWPLVSGRRRRRGSAVNGGPRAFPEETRSAIDGGAVPPDTERAIPGPKREHASALSRLLRGGAVVTVNPNGCGLSPLETGCAGNPCRCRRRTTGKLPPGGHALVPPLPGPVDLRRGATASWSDSRDFCRCGQDIWLFRSQIGIRAGSRSPGSRR